MVPISLFDRFEPAARPGSEASVRLHSRRQPTCPHDERQPGLARRSCFCATQPSLPAASDIRLRKAHSDRERARRRQQRRRAVLLALNHLCGDPLPWTELVGRGRSDSVPTSPSSSMGDRPASAASATADRKGWICRQRWPTLIVALLGWLTPFHRSVYSRVSTFH